MRAYAAVFGACRAAGCRSTAPQSSESGIGFSILLQLPGRVFAAVSTSRRDCEQQLLACAIAMTFPAYLQEQRGVLGLDNAVHLLWSQTHKVSSLVLLPAGFFI